PASPFTLRARMPGGVTPPEHWLVMDALSQKYGNGTLKLTTRDTFQMHGILKLNMKNTIKTIHSALLYTIEACGDVNRK
ncbi:sulfite reductase, partial [Bacillus vallismortis]|nr:sulfite reductase [Bacillus vallismortis]